ARRDRLPRGVARGRGGRGPVALLAHRDEELRAGTRAPCRRPARRRSEERARRVRLRGGTVRPPDGRPKEAVGSMTTVYERQTLSNGLRVLTAPLGHAQSVACYVMLAAGSRYEQTGNRGIAHFAEHMFFKGTE